jgi:4-carboxymuconolactone decarboxylase
VRIQLCLVLMIVLTANAQDKLRLDLRGDRFPGLAYEVLTPAQKVIADRALAGRGGIGIFNITLRSPELSDAMRGITGSRTEPVLSAKQNELAILLTTRFWTTQYAWSVHHRAATQAGLSEETISAIRDARRPATLQPDEVPVYNFVTELLNTKHVGDGAFQEAKEKLGEKRIVDLIGLVGFYQTVSLMMNVDRYPLGNTQKPELQLVARPLPVGPGIAPNVSNAAPPQPKTAGSLRGDRFKALSTGEMTPRQKTVMDLVDSGKLEGGIDGPLNVLLRSPELGEAILRYGAYVRFHVPLSAKLTELAALITLRNWTAQFPWYTHRRAAARVGVSEAVIQAIAEGKRPAGLRPDEQAVYNFCAELLRTTQMSDATFNAAKQQIGERGIVDIMGAMGYYQTVAMLLNTDRYPLPAGVAPELKPLADPIPAAN